MKKKRVSYAEMAKILNEKFNADITRGEWYSGTIILQGTFTKEIETFLDENYETTSGHRFERAGTFEE